MALAAPGCPGPTPLCRTRTCSDLAVWKPSTGTGRYTSPLARAGWQDLGMPAGNRDSNCWTHYRGVIGGCQAPASNEIYFQKSAKRPTQDPTGGGADPCTISPLQIDIYSRRCFSKG